ncbi:HXK1 N-acetylglucosamine kinase 1 [Candida maltosa Xu316]
MITLEDLTLNSDTPKSSYLSEVTDVSSQSSLFSTICHSFVGSLTETNLNTYSDEVFHDFTQALSQNSPITFLPNYNISPTGNEFGHYLVIDLGGSTLRIGVVDIAEPSASKSRSERVRVVIEKSWIIANDFKKIDYNFFKFIGSKINEILSSQHLIDTKSVINTGITWSFPLETTNYNNGKIRHVSKGYTIGEDILDKDLKTVLEEVLAKEFDLKLEVCSILNDSLAVYSAGCFIDNNMKLAMVLGTGLNMCCSLNQSKDIHPKKMLGEATLFNCELSLFGQNLCETFAGKYDSIIDPRFKEYQHHFKTYMEADPLTNTLFQPHELMTSGRYLPELTRLVLVDLIAAGEIFTGNKSLDKILHYEYEGFDGETMCFVNENEDYDKIKEKLCQVYGWSSVSSHDIMILKQVISCIIRRAAFIVANTIIAYIKLLDKYSDDKLQGEVTIGYVGSVLNYFHEYRSMIIDYVNKNEESKKLGLKIDLKLIENSSMIGAAIGAAYYKK